MSTSGQRIRPDPQRLARHPTGRPNHSVRLGRRRRGAAAVGSTDRRRPSPVPRGRRTRQEPHRESNRRPAPGPRSGLVTSFAFRPGPAAGPTQGWVTTQGEVPAGLLAERGPQCAGLLHPHPSHGSRPGARTRPAAAAWRRRSSRSSPCSAVAPFTLSSESILLARFLRDPGGRVVARRGPSHLRHRTPCWVDAPSGRRMRSWPRRRSRPDGPPTSACRPGVIPNVLDLDAYRFRERDPVQAVCCGCGPSSTPTTPPPRRGRSPSSGPGASTPRLPWPARTRASSSPPETWSTGWSSTITSASRASSPDRTKPTADRHDIFLNTNLVDNAPVTALEAAASGLVVVSSDVVGARPPVRR